MVQQVQIYKEYKVTVKSLADIPVKGSKFKTALYRTKFFVEPENLANPVIKEEIDKWEDEIDVERAERALKKAQNRLGCR